MLAKLTEVARRRGRLASQNTRAIRQHDLALLAPSGAAEGAARAMEANAPGESELSGRDGGGGKTPVRLFKCGQTASQFRLVNRSERCNQIFDMIYSKERIGKSKVRLDGFSRLIHRRAKELKQ
jgi:hypothetical protein